MGMMGVFKWLRKDIVQRDRHRRSFSSKFNGLNNESYRTALHAFLERRKDPSDPAYIISPNSPDKAHLDFFTKGTKDNDTYYDKKNQNDCSIEASDVPNARASEIVEICWVAGTEDRYMDLLYAEWQNTKVCLRRHTHPDCKSAVEADVNVLRKIRHPNVLLLMGTSQTDHHELIAIYEPIDCTLFNYIHNQGERVAVQGIVKCIGNLAAALKHAHMLGYIHSAISPHCVFLSSNGIVKLGGWELATDISKPKRLRNYEKRLRTEIFKWQAPELFLGLAASTATDVYGLSLLMWEMCTMNIPWIGFSYAEIEKQYVQQRRTVIIDIYNFPPILKTLLGAGLQLDVTKRTLNIIKMSRFLQRLEMQYEDMEPIFVKQSTNNDNQPKSIGMSQNNISSSCNNFTVPNYDLSNVTTSQYSKKFTSHANRRKTEEMVMPTDSQNVARDKQKLRMKILDEVLQTQSNKNIDFEDLKVGEIVQGMKKINSIRDSCHKTNKTDGEIENINDSRMSIKKLKENLANQRENFFYGDKSLCDASVSIEDPPRTCISSQVRSKHYEPHKPASHKTSLQPKHTISVSQLPAAITRSSFKKDQRLPYSYVPTPIRNAVIQPQILNPNSQSFFETSLWQKEKLICLSKMRRGRSQNHGFHSKHHTEDMGMPRKTSPASDETFTIDVNSSVEDSKPNDDHFTPINESVGDITASTIPRSKSLQALKDALERATDIVRSRAAIIPTITDTSPYKNFAEFGGIIDESYTNKFHKTDKTDQNDVKFIGDSTVEDKFVVGNAQLDGCKNKKENPQYINNESFQDTSKNRNSLVPSSSATQTKSKCTGYTNRHNVFEMMEMEKTEFMYPTRNETARCTSQNNMDHEISDGCFVSYNFNDTTTKEMGCSSCSRNGPIRRRSLPIELGQLSTANYTSLTKLPIKKSDLLDATVEDLYIDDEFDEISLAPNMILMNEDTVSDDENYFPDLLESKLKHAHS